MKTERRIYGFSPIAQILMEQHERKLRGERRKRLTAAQKETLRIERERIAKWQTVEEYYGGAQ